MWWCGKRIMRLLYWNHSPFIKPNENIGAPVSRRIVKSTESSNLICIALYRLIQWLKATISQSHDSIWKTSYQVKGFPLCAKSFSRARVVCIMGIPIVVKRCVFIAMAPGVWCDVFLDKREQFGSPYQITVLFRHHTVSWNIGHNLFR